MPNKRTTYLYTLNGFQLFADVEVLLNVRETLDATASSRPCPVRLPRNGVTAQGRDLRTLTSSCS